MRRNANKKQKLVFKNNRRSNFEKKANSYIKPVKRKLVHERNHDSSFEIKEKANGTFSSKLLNFHVKIPEQNMTKGIYLRSLPVKNGYANFDTSPSKVQRANPTIILVACIVPVVFILAIAILFACIHTQKKKRRKRPKLEPEIIPLLPKYMGSMDFSCGYTEDGKGIGDENKTDEAVFEHDVHQEFETNKTNETNDWLMQLPSSHNSVGIGSFHDIHSHPKYNQLVEDSKENSLLSPSDWINESSQVMGIRSLPLLSFNSKRSFQMFGISDPFGYRTTAEASDATPSTPSELAERKSYPDSLQKVRTLRNSADSSETSISEQEAEIPQISNDSARAEQTARDSYIRFPEMQNGEYKNCGCVSSSSPLSFGLSEYDSENKSYLSSQSRCVSQMFRSALCNIISERQKHQNQTISMKYRVSSDSTEAGRTDKAKHLQKLSEKNSAALSTGNSKYSNECISLKPKRILFANEDCPEGKKNASKRRTLKNQKLKFTPFPHTKYHPKFISSPRSSRSQSSERYTNFRIDIKNTSISGSGRSSHIINSTHASEKVVKRLEPSASFSSEGDDDSVFQTPLRSTSMHGQRTISIMEPPKWLTRISNPRRVDMHKEQLATSLRNDTQSESSKTSKGTENSETSEKTENSEASERTENSETSERIESSETSERIESSETSERIESSETSERIESSETSGKTESSYSPEGMTCTRTFTKLPKDGSCGESPCRCFSHEFSTVFQRLSNQVVPKMLSQDERDIRNAADISSSESEYETPPLSPSDWIRKSVSLEHPLELHKVTSLPSFVKPKGFEKARRYTCIGSIDCGPVLQDLPNTNKRKKSSRNK